MGRLTNDPEKLIHDLTELIFDRFRQEVDFSQIDPFTMKHLREEIRELIEIHADIGEEAFNAAFEEGESKGFESGQQEMRERIRDFTYDL